MSERVDAFLSGIVGKSRQMGRLMFALDATGSREPTWDTASQLQADMFRAAAAIGGLEVQLVYFRGMTGVNDECKASPWLGEHITLARLMAKIRCETGLTQITKVLQHALRETSQRRIGAVTFVGDACEEKRKLWLAPVRELAAAGVPVFMFQEGYDPVARLCFEEIARLTHGAYHRFDQGSARLLGDLLRAVAAFAAGGVRALERDQSAAAKLLLRQMS